MKSDITILNEFLAIANPGPTIAAATLGYSLADLQRIASRFHRSTQGSRWRIARRLVLAGVLDENLFIGPDKLIIEQLL